MIGRGDNCEIALANNSVSRRQARIDTSPSGEQIVTDLSSTNGTFVNNVRVESKVLKDGDYLRVGDCILRFLAGGNVEASYHEEIHRLTIIDPLTGLSNRRSLDASWNSRSSRLSGSVSRWRSCSLTSTTSNRSTTVSGIWPGISR